MFLSVDFIGNNSVELNVKGLDLPGPHASFPYLQLLCLNMWPSAHGAVCDAMETSEARAWMEESGL